ncbi:MFS transporter [Streptococcus suis]|uniref:MFS transporter n=1 Tax=Streptococcus suis TaxID=1307 RepID=UPI000C190FEB|nr:MFS transporter [Streptococcus suis]HEL1592140.1 MFS transporter [Streptococcus suis]HEL1811602.1 MFS transporter [Streptococcus suis]
MIRNLKLYYLVNFLFNFARVLPHSILTILLMKKGLTISEISIIQSIYMIVALLSEFPSGIVTEIIGEKQMYQLSLILLTISYSGIYFGKGIIILSILWGIYGLSAASMTGTLEAYFYKNLKLVNIDIKNFNIQNRYVLLVSSLLGAFLGSILFKYIDEKIYIISVFLLIISTVICILGIKINKKTVQYEDKNVDVVLQIKEILKATISLRRNSKLAILVSLSCVFQIIIQLHFQYWQIIFQYKGISFEYFGFIYVIFQLFSIFSTFIFSKINIENSGTKLLIIISSVFSLSFIFSLITSSTVIFIIIFSVFLFGFNLYDNTLDYLIVKYVDSEFLSSFISLLGTLSTIISAIVLLFIASLLKFFSLMFLAIIMIIVFLIITVILIIFFNKNVINDV